MNGNVDNEDYPQKENTETVIASTTPKDSLVDYKA
jgi:hypothetical protein